MEELNAHETNRELFVETLKDTEMKCMNGYFEKPKAKQVDTPLVRLAARVGQVAPRRRYINLIRETGRAKARYKSNRGTRHVSFTARTAAQTTARTAAQAGGCWLWPKMARSAI